MNTSSDSDSLRPKILVVDDLYANRVAMRHVLSGLDVEIVEADSGNSALAACLEYDFALILLDVQMPYMDGMEVAQLLRGEASTRDTPVIFVTAGSTGDMDRLKGYDAGAIDYIVKPVNGLLLSAKVRNFLDLYKNRQALERALAELDERNAQLQREIDERKRAEARARQLATHDGLTGLPNRLLFVDRLATSMQRADRGKTRFALGYMDLDGFKMVNDAYGHRAGDAVLNTIADRMREHTRASDTTARFGGDEFALIFENVSDVDRCLEVCERLRVRLSAPIRVPCGGQNENGEGDRGRADEEVEVQVGVSLGIALYPDHGEDADRLMHNADRALYAVKSRGKGGTRLFSEHDGGLAARAAD